MTQATKTAPNLTWLTTTLHEVAKLQQLSFGVVAELAAQANRITIVAAYWDERFLNKLLAAVPVVSL